MTRFRPTDLDGDGAERICETDVDLDLDTLGEVTFEVYDYLAKAMREGYGTASIRIEVRE